MSRAIVDDRGTFATPISLYLGFPKGEAIELRQAAAIAVAWADAVSGLFAEVEPGIHVRIELVDGDDGSLWLNTLLRMAETALEQVARGADAYPRLKALAKGLAIIVVATPLQMTAEQVWEAIIEDEPEIAELSPAAQDQIQEAFVKALREEAAEAERDRFSREVSKTPQIDEVGVSSHPGPKPTLRVSREDHKRYVERERTSEENTRMRVVTRDVVLVSPVLDHAERSWKFREPGMPEFGAVMRDADFLEAIGRGAIHEELRFGIPMTIDLEIKEVRHGDTWVPDGRSVVRVHTPAIERRDLFRPAS